MGRIPTIDAGLRERRSSNGAETAMKLVQIEHALGMIRTYLVECVAHDDWSDHLTAELTEVISACVRRLAAEERPSSAAPAARVTVRRL